jgi:predicted alpha/beta-hydrolase family hydrolase
VDLGAQGSVPRVYEIMTSAGPATVVLELPASPAFLAVLTHGAGGTPDTADVLAVRDAARALGGATALVTQPYRVKGARAPGSAVKQDAAWAELVAVLREQTANGGAPLPFIQCGRSNGARVACRTAGQLGASGVIALAFPLHPPGQPEKSRDAELRSAGTSVLVVNGDRDPFGVPEPDERTVVVVLRGETHTLAKHPALIGEAVTAWLGGLAALGLAGPGPASEWA